MKLKNKTWLKLLCVPLSCVQFIIKRMYTTSLIQTLILSLYNTIPLLIPNFLLRLASNIIHFSIVLLEMNLTLNFRLNNLRPCPIQIDDKTVMNFWIPRKINLDKPTLTLIHGYGANSRWQFYWQIRQLARTANLFVPDLLFFGDSHTGRAERTDVFQAECVGEGMRRLGLSKYSVAGISYGGYVAFRMGEMFPNEVEKVVIVSSGICYTEEDKVEHLKRIGRSPLDFLVPNNTHDLRCLLRLCIYKYDPAKWIPDFFLQEGITVLHKDYRKEKSEILEYLLNKEADSNLGVLSQETLIIWGDKDMMFPIKQAYLLERHLEPKAKVAVIKDTGHAVNFDAPTAMNNLILSFIKK